LNRCLKPSLMDLVIYSVYKAINEILREDTWRVVWRSGEILLESLDDILGIKDEKDLYSALDKIFRWLIDMGYIEHGEIKRSSENEIEYVMSTPVIGSGAEKLIKEGMVPPHISTSLLFALLKRYGLKAEMIGRPIFLEDGRVIERWRISEIR